MKNLKNLGKVLKKEEQKMINGGRPLCPPVTNPLECDIANGYWMGSACLHRIDWCTIR